MALYIMQCHIINTTDQEGETETHYGHILSTVIERRPPDLQTFTDKLGMEYDVAIIEQLQSVCHLKMSRPVLVAIEYYRTF